MGVFKEHAHAFEDVAAKQQRIFNDACDCGYPYSTSNVPDAIKSAFYFINDLKGSSLVVKRESWLNGVTITIRIGWEIDEDMECGTQYLISFNKINPKHPSLICKGCDAFISVDISSYRVPHQRRSSNQPF